MATYIAIASAVASGIAGLRSSQAQANQLKAQAKQAELQGRADAIEYKRQSVEVMRRMNAVISANVASSASRGMNPFASGGVTDVINNYNRRYAMRDVISLKQNAQMAKDMAQYQAGQYRASASAISKIAPLQFLGTVGTGFARAEMIGGPGAPSNWFSGLRATATPGVNIGIQPYSDPYSRGYGAYG
jgi:hypothetical protein